VLTQTHKVGKHITSLAEVTASSFCDFNITDKRVKRPCVGKMNSRAEITDDRA